MVEHVGDGRRLRHADAEHAARGAGVARANADEHADGAGAHEVQRGGVAGHAADDHRHGALGDELLEVERLDPGADVLGRDHSALDDEHVEAGLECDPVVLLHALRGERGCRQHAAVLDLLDTLGDELGLDRLLVDLLHLFGQRRDAVELLVGVLVARLHALEVEHGEPAELAHGDGEGGVDHAVHRRGEARKLERVRTELPGDVDVLGVARATARHDGDVVEPVGAATLFAAADLYFHAVLLRGARTRLNKRPGHRRAGVSELCAVRMGELDVSLVNVVRLYQLEPTESTLPGEARPTQSGRGVAKHRRPPF